MTRVTHPIRPGGLSGADHERIFELAERGWNAGRIAATIEKHPATVYWFMISQALVAPGPSHRDVYFRKGRQVTPYSPDEDAFITALRVQSFAHIKIAELASKRFDHPRTAHSIKIRLIMLAAREDAGAA